MIISTLLKIAFIYSAFVFIKSLLRAFFNFKIESVKQNHYRKQSPKESYNTKEKDYTKSAGKVVDAEFKVLKD